MLCYQVPDIPCPKIFSVPLALPVDIPLSARLGIPVRGPGDFSLPPQLHLDCYRCMSFAAALVFHFPPATVALPPSSRALCLRAGQSYCRCCGCFRRLTGDAVWRKRSLRRSGALQILPLLPYTRALLCAGVVEGRCRLRVGFHLFHSPLVLLNL